MSERLSLAELDHRCRSARKKVAIGSFWQHYTGTVYEVKLFSVREDDGELLISYKPVRDNDNGVLKYVEPEYASIDAETGSEVYDDVVFTRPFFEWQQEVTISDHNEHRFGQVYRYHGYRKECRHEQRWH